MIKKLFLCAALVGAVGLTSCVDDVESASVTEIRNAKAAQLKALADVEKANAEAAIIKANALMKEQEIAAAAQKANEELIKSQAAYNNAQAAYYQAQAAYQQAQADAKNADTDQKKAQAEIELEKAKIALEKEKITLEERKIDLENKKLTYEENKSKLERYLAETKKLIAEYQFATDKLKYDLIELISNITKTLNNGQNGPLQVAMNLYTTQLDNLTTLNNTLADEQFTLSLAKAGLVKWGDQLKNDIEKAYASQREAKAVKDELEAQVKIYQAADYETATTQIAKLKEDQSKLIAAVRDLALEYQAKATDLEDASKAVADSPYMEAIDVFTNTSSPTITYPSNTDYAVSVVKVTDASTNGNSTVSPAIAITTPNAPLDLYNTWCVMVKEKDNSGNNYVYTYTPLFTTGDKSSNKKTITVKINDKGEITFPENPSTNPNEKEEFTYEYFDYSDPYYALVDNGKGGETLNNIMAANVAKVKEADDNAKAVLGSMKAQQTAFAPVWKTYEDAKKAKDNLATDATEAETKAANDAFVAAVKALWPVMQKANEAIEKAQEDGDITNSSIETITGLEAELPETAEGTDWDAIVSAINTNGRTLEANIDYAVATATSTQLSTASDLADAEKNQDLVSENLKALTGNADAFKTLVKDADAAIEAATTAKGEYDTADKQLNLVKAQINAYANIAADPSVPTTVYYKSWSSSTKTWTDTKYVDHTNNEPILLNTVANVDGLVKLINQSIAEADKQITEAQNTIDEKTAELKAGYQYGTNDNDAYNEIIAKQEAKIAQLKSQIAAQEEAVKAAKANLDAILNTLAALQPDAPAEK